MEVNLKKFLKICEQAGMEVEERTEDAVSLTYSQSAKNPFGDFVGYERVTASWPVSDEGTVDTDDFEIVDWSFPPAEECEEEHGEGECDCELYIPPELDYFYEEICSLLLP